MIVLVPDKKAINIRQICESTNDIRVYMRMNESIHKRKKSG